MWQSPIGLLWYSSLKNIGVDGCLNPNLLAQRTYNLHARQHTTMCSLFVIWCTFYLCLVMFHMGEGKRIGPHPSPWLYINPRDHPPYDIFHQTIVCHIW
jgi:hypothetical protein